MAGIDVTVGETKIDVAVSGGVGPTGSQGPSGVVTVSAPITNSGTTSAASIGLSVGSGLAVTGGSLVLASHQHTIADTAGLQAALDGKAASTHTHTASQITDFTSAVVAAAPPTTNASLLTSGTLPDARLSSNIARTSDVSSAVAAVVNAAPAALDTLKELATALGNDASFSVTVTNALAAKAPINNPTFTGTVSGVTKAMVGLGNVDNTSDANKPISTATQTALDGKAAASHTHNGGQINIFGENGDGTTLSDGSYAASYLFMLNDDTVSAWEFLTDGKVFKPQNIIPGNQSYDFDIFGWDMNDSLVDIVGTISSAIQSRAYAEHNHGTISHDGRIGTTPGQIVVTTTGGALTTAATISASSVSGLATVATSGSAAHLVTGTLSASRLPTSGVTAGTYTSVTVDATGRVTAGSSPAGYTLPTATASVLGGVKIGSGISIDGNGVISASSGYTLPNATTSTLGGVIVGSGLSVISGTVSANVTSVAGRTGAVTIAAGDVSGLAASATTDTTNAANISSGSLAIGRIPTGTTSSTVCIGNDSRLSDTRTPTDGSVTDAKIASGGLSTSVLNWSAIQPWAANTAYAKGDLVEYLGRAYRRVSAGTSGATFSSTNWQATTPAEFVGSQITSGTIPVARLGTGSPSSSNYLRGDGSFAPAVASVDGSTGAVTVTKATVYEFTRSTAPSNATGSNGNWSWPLPSGAKILEVICIGGGGGGGSGRRGATNENRFGGGGGAGGLGMIATINAASITTNISVIVGGGGAGGASRLVTDAPTNTGLDGNSGQGGGASSVSFNGSAWVSTVGGPAGSGGTTTTGSGGTADTINPRTFSSTSGGAASVTASGGTPGAAAGLAGTGGGAGGSINASNTIFSPGSYRTASGTAGYFLQVPVNTSAQPAGAASTTGDATAGPNANAYGNGGNGGGASTNGVGNSGAGGSGGDGYVRITVWS